MKHKMFALILALTVMSWAQTATPTAPSAPAQDNAPAEKAKCPCCEKMAADAKDAHSCCAHRANQNGETKEMASCCAGKDAKSCKRDGKAGSACCNESCGRDKNAANCGDKCGKECKEGCCAKKAEKAAGNCCHREHRG